MESYQLNKQSDSTWKLDVESITGTEEEIKDKLNQIKKDVTNYFLEQKLTAKGVVTLRSDYEEDGYYDDDITIEYDVPFSWLMETYEIHDLSYFMDEWIHGIDIYRQAKEDNVISREESYGK